MKSSAACWGFYTSTVKLQTPQFSRCWPVTAVSGFDLWPVSVHWLQWAISLGLIKRSVPTTVIRGVKPNLPTCSRLEGKKKRIPQPQTARVLPAIRSPLCSCVSRSHLCAGSVPRCGVCKGPARQSAGTRWSGHAAKSHLGLSRGYQAASYCQSSSGSSFREPQRFLKNQP